MFLAFMALLALPLAFAGSDDDVAPADPQDDDMPPDPPENQQGDLLDPPPPDAEDPPEPYVHPNAGDQLIEGTARRDELDGGPGSDTLIGFEGRDRLFGDDAPRIGGVGMDYGDDLLDGGPGDDWLAGNGGLDTLLGSDGDDWIFDQDLGPGLTSGGNASLVDAGPGDDRIDVDAGSTVTGGAGADDISIFVPLDDTGVSVITDFDPAEDMLDVTLTAGDGTPVDFALEPAADGSGMELWTGDRLLVRFPGLEGATLDDIDLVVQMDYDSALDSLQGDDTGLTIVGNSADNTITGGEGDDVLLAGLGFGPGYGAGGSDLLQGGAGNDLLVGLNGSEPAYDAVSDDFRIAIHPDTLIGGTGDDILVSQHHNDLTGGRGADVFALEKRFDADIPGATRITDFDPGEDVIMLEMRRTGTGSELRDLSLRVWEDGQGADLVEDGRVLAEIAGGQSLTPDQIRQVDSLRATIHDLRTPA